MLFKASVMPIGRIWLGDPTPVCHVGVVLAGFAAVLACRETLAVCAWATFAICASTSGDTVEDVVEGTAEDVVEGTVEDTGAAACVVDAATPVGFG